MKPLRVGLALLVGLLVCGEPLMVMAQKYTPPRRGLPGRREGAGTRGGCLQGTKSLMPLTPQDGFSATVSDSPTLFWYVPGSPARSAEFALLDARDQPVYRITLPLTGQDEILSHRLPSEVSSSLLIPGQDYRWMLSLECDEEDPSSNPFVEGTLQRVEPDSTLKTQLQKALPVDQASVYASAGLWQDALMTLAQQRCDRPQDSSLVDRWNRLLGSVELERYAQQPLGETCSGISSNPNRPDRSANREAIDRATRQVQPSNVQKLQVHNKTETLTSKQ